jgi:shikimate dehydrogenase
MLLTGIIGYPLEKTFSPRMHNSAFNALGVDGLYIPLPVTEKNLAPVLKGLYTLGFQGVNVTTPHKQSVCKFLDGLHEEAAKVETVNTIIINHQTLTGYNTDIFGFAESLRRLHIHVIGRSVLLIGAGGVARTCAYILQTMSFAHLFVTNRNKEKGHLCAAQFGGEFIALDVIDEVVPHSDLIINATSVNVQRCILPLMKPGATYYDLNYKFRLLKKKGVKVYNGLLMLVLQGAKAFSLWTGKTVPIEIMKQEVGLL